MDPRHRRPLRKGVQLLSMLGPMVTMTLQAGVASPGTDGPGAIVIVPLESPPLTFRPGIDAQQAVAANTGAGLSWAAGETVAEARRTLFVIPGIVILASLPERTRQADKRAESPEAVLNAADVFLPPRSDGMGWVELP